MTNGREERNQLSRLADAMVEDILEAPAAEILEDFGAARGDPAVYAAAMKARFQMALLTANKSRMIAAKAAISAARFATSTSLVIDISQARKVLKRILASPAVEHCTLAARNESELSDADVLGMLEDMRELGLWTPGSDESGS